jgi:hypothetical protein
MRRLRAVTAKDRGWNPLGPANLKENNMAHPKYEIGFYQRFPQETKSLIHLNRNVSNVCFNRREWDITISDGDVSIILSDSAIRHLYELSKQTIEERDEIILQRSTDK